MYHVLTSSQSKLCDKNCIDNGVSLAELIERAGEALSQFVKQKAKSKKITFFCGGRNNGADGLCAAKILQKENFEIKIFLFYDNLSEECKYFLQDLKNVYHNKIDNFCNKDVAVDCIFGTGFKGKLEGKYADAIKFANMFTQKFACDIPSGLNADNGIADKNSFKADKTITFQNYKCGHFLSDGKDFCGEISVADIGIKLTSESQIALEDCDLKKYFPKRKNNCHKGCFGKCTFVAGSENFFGAAMLCEAANCALRLGAGYSTLVTSLQLKPYVLSRIFQSTAHFFDEFSEDFFNKIIDNSDCIACGMGMTNSELTFKISHYLLKNCNIPLILDADSLNSLAQSGDLYGNGKTIITPHVKEFSRLTKLSVEEILENPIEISKEFARKHNLIVLLKGTASIITDGEKTYISTNGTPALAKAGSGDILAGILCAMLTKPYPLLELAAASCHILNASANAKNMPPDCVLAEEIIKNIPFIVNN